MSDSEERSNPPRCHSHTRVTILKDIDRWARGVESKPILWLSGPAAAGKSAIVQTLAELWKSSGVVCASFFFSRTSAGQNNKTRVLPGIIYQIYYACPGLQPYIERAISRDPAIFKKSLKYQFQALVVDPLATLSFREELAPSVVIIDGLDECSNQYKTQSGEEQQKEILESVQLVAIRNLPIRFLIASRRETQIRNSFDSEAFAGITSCILLTEDPDAVADIERFLRDEFAAMKFRNQYVNPSWPTDDDIHQLVQKSSGLFGYPSTAVRYLSTRRDPKEALKEILSLSSTNKNSSQPLAPLDRLYTHILNSVASHSLPNVSDIFQLLVHSKSSHFSRMFHRDNVPTQSVEHMATILACTSAQIWEDLSDLHSILEVPKYPKSDRIRFIHATFSDFLVDGNRSGPFRGSGPASLRLQIKLLGYAERRIWDLHPLTTSRLFLLVLDNELISFWHAQKGRRNRARVRLAHAPRLFLRSLLMSPAQEAASSPLRWWCLSMKRNTEFIVLYGMVVYRLYRYSWGDLELPCDWFMGVILMTLAQVKIVSFTQISISAIGGALSLCPFVLRPFPHLDKFVNSLVVAIESTSALLSYTYLLSLSVMIILFVHYAHRRYTCRGPYPYEW